MTWCAFAVSLCVLFLDNVHCGKVCKYEIQGIEGFHGEIKLDGAVHAPTTVFPIVFLVEGHPLSDWRYAVLQNFLDLHYFTVYSILHTTNEIRATRTAPVGVAEVLQIGPESVNECTFYLTVTVGPSVLVTTESSTVTTIRSTSTVTSSTLPTTVREDSTAMSTVTPTRTTSLSTASSSPRRTESVTPRVCQYELQGIDGFAGEIKREGPIFMVTPVFSIIFLIGGDPLPDGPRAILKNPQEVHYFTVTLNTNEVMAYNTVPVGTSEVLEIGPESVDECTFYLTVIVGPSMTKTLVSTSRLMSSMISSTKASISTITSVSQTGSIEHSTTLSIPWTTETVTLGVCKYEIQGIDGFVGEINVDGPLIMITTVFHITFLMDGNSLPDSKRAELKNHQELQYFTVTINTNEIMTTKTVPVGTSEVLEISPDGVDECSFYLTVNVQDPVITTTAKTTVTSFGPESSTTPPMSSSAFVSLSVTQRTTLKSTSANALSTIISATLTPRAVTSKSMTSTLSTMLSSNSSNSASFTLSVTQPTTLKSTSANALSTIISATLTPRVVTSKSMTSTLSTMLRSNSSNSASFTLSTSVNSLAVSPRFFSGVVFRGAFRFLSILFYGIILSCF